MREKDNEIENNGFGLCHIIPFFTSLNCSTAVTSFMYTFSARNRQNCIIRLNPLNENTCLNALTNSTHLNWLGRSECKKWSLGLPIFCLTDVLRKNTLRQNMSVCFLSNCSQHDKKKYLSNWLKVSIIDR